MVPLSFQNVLCLHKPSPVRLSHEWFQQMEVFCVPRHTWLTHPQPTHPCHLSHTPTIAPTPSHPTPYSPQKPPCPFGTSVIFIFMLVPPPSSWPWKSMGILEGWLRGMQTGTLRPLGPAH